MPFGRLMLGPDLWSGILQHLWLNIKYKNILYSNRKVTIFKCTKESENVEIKQLHFDLFCTSLNPK